VTRARATTILTGAAFLFLIVLFAIAQYRDLARPPHVDEAEYLHGAARIALGDRIFVDFFEHHPPLFFGMLSLLAPERRGFDEAVAFVARARVFAGLCAAIAIVAAASIVYRATGRLYAPLIFVALMLAAVPVWRNGIGDVRPETAALAFWWVGAALVVLAKRPWLRGLGLGLVFVAAVIVPKWPLESLVVAIVFFTRGAGVPPAFRRASRPAVSAGRDGRREASGTLALRYAGVSPRTRATTREKSTGSIGLRTYARNPASRSRSSVFASATAVRATAGRWAVAALARRCCISA